MAKAAIARNPNASRPDPSAEKPKRERKQRAPKSPNAPRPAPKPPREKKVKPPKPEKPAIVLERTEHQGGTYIEVRRDMIAGCSYNPRKISSYARNLLKKKLESVGCVTPIVFNRRTGNVVAGNQRLSILDELEGNQSYMVGVMAIDVDEKTEREMNVALNNRQSQGQFDKEAFLELVRDGSLDLAEAGMTRIDLEIEFGRLPEIAGIFAQEQQAAQGVVNELQEIAGASPFRAEFRKKQAEAITKTRSSAALEGEYFAVIVFETGELKPWMERNGFVGAKYLLASQVIPLVRR